MSSSSSSLSCHRGKTNEAYHIEDYLIIKGPKEEDDKKPLQKGLEKPAVIHAQYILIFHKFTKKKESFKCPKSIRNYEKKNNT